MDRAFKLVALSPEKVLFEGEAISVAFCGGYGNMEVLAGHASLISLVRSGQVIITQPNGQKSEFQAEQGFFRIENDDTQLCLMTKDYRVAE